ncbi:hypothetical protein T439DRAFT_321005 [Meredithblackwellia eburnea MCA 4105]
MVAVIWAGSYFFAVFASLAIFSKIYRKRKQNQPPPPSWFGPHKSRDIYISLLSLEKPPPNQILIAALLRRAVDDVKLIWKVRDQKQALSTLLQKGQIGDDCWERFLLAEKELEAEIVEVVGEANTFLEGYGQNIFHIASEMATHEKWKEVYTSIPKERKLAEERLALPAVSLALAPTVHLTPSSLTLYPSNPLSLSAPTSPTNPSATLAPPATLPVGPPSRESTPVPSTSTATPTKSSNTKKSPSPSPAGNQNASATPSKSKSPVASPGGPAAAATLAPPPASTPGGKSASGDEDEEEEEGNGQAPSTPSGAQKTPGSAKKGNKKKKGKGKK